MQIDQISSAATAAPPARKPALHSVLSNWAGLAVNTVLSLVLTPILVHGLGDARYGMWMLIGSLLDSSWLLDFGMRATVFRFVARYKGSGERDSLDSTFASGVAVVGASAIVILLLSFASIFVLPGLFAVSPEARPLFMRLLPLSGASVAAGFTAQFLGSYICANCRFDLYNLVSAASGILRAILIVLALHLGFGVIGVAISTLTCSVLLLVASVWLVRVADPGLSFSLGKIQRCHIRKLMSFSGYSFLATLGDQLRFFVDSIVIGRILSLAMITPFNIAARIVTLFRLVMAALGSPFAGRMSEMEGQHAKEELRSYFLLATRLACLLSFFFGILLILNGRAIIRLWVGEAYAQACFPLLAVLLTGHVIMLAQAPCGDLLLAKGEHRLRGWWTMSEGIANLVLSIYWGRKYGLIGVALGTSVPMVLVQVFIQPWYTFRKASISALRYFQEGLARPLLAAGLLLAACLATRNLQNNSSLAGAVFTVAWECSFALVLALMIGITESERRYLVRSCRDLFA